jgi:hypothetical protein
MESKEYYVVFDIKGKKDNPDFSGGRVKLPVSLGEEIEKVVNKGDERKLKELYVRIIQKIKESLKERVDEEGKVEISLGRGGSDWYRIEWIEEVIPYKVERIDKVECPYLTPKGLEKNTYYDSKSIVSFHPFLSNELKNKPKTRRRMRR